MSKLKTLKDFGKDKRCPSCSARYKPKCIQEYNLKREVIKRIKYYLKKLDLKVDKIYSDEHDIDSRVCFSHTKDGHCQEDPMKDIRTGKILELIDFFNITDEDLEE